MACSTAGLGKHGGWETDTYVMNIYIYILYTVYCTGMGIQYNGKRIMEGRKRETVR